PGDFHQWLCMTGNLHQVWPIIAAHAAGIDHAGFYQHGRSFGTPVAGWGTKTFSTDVQMLPEHFAAFAHDVLLLRQGQGIEGLVFVAVIRHFMASLDNRLALPGP